MFGTIFQMTFDKVYYAFYNTLLISVLWSSRLNLSQQYYIYVFNLKIELHLLVNTVKRITSKHQNQYLISLYISIFQDICICPYTLKFSYCCNCTNLQDRIIFTSKKGQYFKSQEGIKLFYLFIYKINYLSFCQLIIHYINFF